MGVDAEMFVRVPRKLQPEFVRQEAIRIQTAFGPGTFYIERPETTKKGGKKKGSAGSTFRFDIRSSWNVLDRNAQSDLYERVAMLFMKKFAQLEARSSQDDKEQP